MYRYLFQVIADKEDKREQLIETLETHKYHFEQVCVFVCACVWYAWYMYRLIETLETHIYPFEQVWVCVCVCVIGMIYVPAHTTSKRQSKSPMIHLIPYNNHLIPFNNHIHIITYDNDNNNARDTYIPLWKASQNRQFLISNTCMWF